MRSAVKTILTFMAGVLTFAIWINFFVPEPKGIDAEESSDDAKLESVGGEPNASLSISITEPKWQKSRMSFVANGDIHPWQEAVIGSELSGVQILDVLVNVGDAVEKDQLLVRLSDDALQADYQQARASLLQAKANLTNAKSNADRMRGIADKGIIAQQEIDAAYTQEEVAAMQLQAAQAVLSAQRIRLGNTKVIAPDNGLISSRSATVGQVVAAGQELFRLIRQNRLEWRAQLTTEEVAQVAVHDVIYIELSDGTDIAGTVRSIAPIAEASTRNITVFVDIPQHPQLRSGEYISGRFEGLEENALIVPNESVIVRDGFNYVFKVDENNLIHRLKVEVGSRFENGTQILSGLEEGARIAVDGAGFLNDGDFVRVIE